MHKNGGIIKRLSAEAQQEIMEIIEKQKGSAVPIGRENNQFIVEMFVPDQEESQGGVFELAKKTFKGKMVKQDSKTQDFRSQTAWESFWDMENDSGFHWQA